MNVAVSVNSKQKQMESVYAKSKNKKEWYLSWHTKKGIQFLPAIPTSNSELHNVQAELEIISFFS